MRQIRRSFASLLILSLLCSCSSRPARSQASLTDPLVIQNLSPGTTHESPGSGHPAPRLVSETHPRFDWPVDEARMTRGFFLKDPHHRHGRSHLGLDLAAPSGTPILAAHDGTVIYVGREFRGFGRMVMIEGKGGFASLYAHMVRTRAHEGQIVHQGDLIGDMGRTGHATGVHLHFEIRTKAGPVDPLLYLPNAPQLADHTRLSSSGAD